MSKNDQHNTTAYGSLNTYELVLTSMFVGMIAVCSWISIPAEIPFTMQTFAIFLTLGLLGGRRGTIAVITYLLLGILGAPVFSGFTGGLNRLIGPTGGYILGFLFSALIMWGMETVIGRSTVAQIISMITGLLICYLFGTIWFISVYGGQSGYIGIIATLDTCVFPFVIPDILKIVLAINLTKRLAPVIWR